MCTKRSLVGSLLVLSVFHMGLGVSCVSLGVIGVTQTLWQQKSQHSFSPIWSGACVISSLWTKWDPVCEEENWTDYDPIFCLLHLWAYRRDSQCPVCEGDDETGKQPALFSSSLPLPGQPGHSGLHPLHLADMQTRQL
ncbi:uncharacterized protein tmem196b isoform X3 [Danio rerio]|uniref:Uncharacterized protein tmem196b isoform X3 n=1 Tax=Danio rerio TaxID=7955 RepID=A0AC58HHX5_DANRE